MKKIISMKTLVFISAILIAFTSYGQDKVLLDQAEDISEYSAKEFELAMMAPEGELYLFGQEFGIKGEYTFKISVGLKNKVTSVFVIERKGGDIPTQNKVKDAVKEFKFITFKVPKGKHYNVEYTFKF